MYQLLLVRNWQYADQTHIQQFEVFMELCYVANKVVGHDSRFAVTNCKHWPLTHAADGAWLWFEAVGNPMFRFELADEVVARAEVTRDAPLL